MTRRVPLPSPHRPSPCASMGPSQAQLLHKLLEVLDAEAIPHVIVRGRRPGVACLVIDLDETADDPAVELIGGEAVVVLEEGQRVRVTRSMRRQHENRSVTPSEASPLTQRQLEILSLLADGLAPKEIAPMLGITIHTCRGHIKRARERLGCTTVWQVIVEAMRHGWLPSPTLSETQR